VIRYRLPDGMEPPTDLGTRSGSDAGMVELEVDDPVAPLNQLTSWALAHSVPLDGLEVARPTLEDVYLALTGGTSAAIDPEPDRAPGEDVAR